LLFDLFLAYPKDEPGFWRWFAILMFGYILISCLVRLVFDLRKDKKHVFSNTIIFDSATFGTSIAILWGIVDPNILKLLGSTTLYLIIVGFSGLVYSIYAIFHNQS
jgi:hypothetical protein